MRNRIGAVHSNALRLIPDIILVKRGIDMSKRVKELTTDVGYRSG